MFEGERVGGLKMLGTRETTKSISECLVSPRLHFGLVKLCVL